MFPNKKLIIHPRDNIIVALTNLSKGDKIDLDVDTITLVSDVKAKHKFAMRNFAVGEEIYMYGVSALGKKGGNHTVSMLKQQLTQVMEQMSCAEIQDLQTKLITK